MRREHATEAIAGAWRERYRQGWPGGECLESRVGYARRPAPRRAPQQAPRQAPLRVRPGATPGAARRRPGRGARSAEGFAPGAGVAEITAVRKSQLFRHARPEPNTLRKRLTWYG